MNEQSAELKHDVVMRNRKRLEMNGITDVTSFDEREIVALSGECSISIEGEMLKIEKFNAESGDLVVNGTVNGIFYFSKEPIKRKKSFYGLFK